MLNDFMDELAWPNTAKLGVSLIVGVKTSRIDADKATCSIAIADASKMSAL